MKKICAVIPIGVLILSILLASLIFSSNRSISDTVISESHITTDTTWNISNSPYFIEGHVTVDFGVNLTIEPGVEVRFNGFFSLYIEGNLTAIGNSSERIEFTSNKTTPSDGDWDRIQVNSTGSAKIQYSNITYGNYGLFAEHSLKSDIQNTIISDNTNQGIKLNSSNENVIKSNLISYNSIGMGIYQSSNNTISDNEIVDNIEYGIMISESWENHIQSNNLSGNVEGLRLYKSTDNTIFNNNILSNAFRGLYLYLSDSNMIGYNLIFSNDGSGIELHYSSTNEVSNNNISLNGGSGSYYGIALNTSQNNRVFHNTLIDNINQAYDNGNDNDWDEGYPDGGNYWNDYAGEDIYRGLNQDIPGNDGIGDVPYILDSDSLDNFPLMNKSRGVISFFVGLISPANNSVIKAGTIIDFEILTLDVDHVNYTVNGGMNNTLPYPFFDIDTFGWPDGDSLIKVYVIDNSSNMNSSWFFFILDSTNPEIVLNSPNNNSIIAAGEIINLSISDPFIKSVNYSIDNGPRQSLLFPYDFNTSTWPDDIYQIEIAAEDIAGNINSTYYLVTLDSTPPTIYLNSPANNSYIRAGTPINLSIADEHLASVNYSLNNGPILSFTTAYIINTSLLPDGNYSIEVNAVDIPGNSQSVFYNITLDSTSPSVVLNEPQNNSIIREGFLNFSVFDASPVTFSYSLNYGVQYTLETPYTLDLSSRSDGNFIVSVNVTDYAGNFNRSWFNITTDTIYPMILVSQNNNSFFQSGTEIAIDVYDSHLAYARYSVNGGEFQNIIPSQKIDTTDWTEGQYNIEITAGDSIGNNISVIFVFTVDNTPPRIASSSPRNGDEGVARDTSITINFNEGMNRTSVRNALSISPTFYFITNWNSDNTTLTLIPMENLTNATTYTIVVNNSAKDLAGNTLAEDFILSFYTGSSDKEEQEWLSYVAVFTIILIIISLILLMRRRRKGISDEDDEDEFEVGKEAAVGEDKTEDEEGIEGEEEEYILSGEEAKSEKEDEVGIQEDSGEELDIEAEDSNP